MPNKNPLGIGAEWSVLMRYLHPRHTVKSMFENTSLQDTINDLLFTGEKELKVNQNMQIYATFLPFQF